VLVFRVLNALLVVYLLLLMLRMILSWFQRSVAARPMALLLQVTEPYLALFRGLRFLRVGPVDLSPLAAILVLAMALDLVSALRDSGRLSLGILLAALTHAAWFGLSFLLVAVLLLVVLLVVSIAFGRGTASGLVRALAAVLQPVTAWVRSWAGGMFGRRRPLNETQILVLAAIVSIVILIAGSFLVPLLHSALLQLPL
jgi:YggT family protein